MTGTMNPFQPPVLALDLANAVTHCVVLAVAFVLSLYVLGDGFDRDHPQTVRNRLKSVSVVTVLSALSVFMWGDFSSPTRSYMQVVSDILALLGVRLWTPATILAPCLPLCLTAVLFLAPLVARFVDGDGPRLFIMEWQTVYTPDDKLRAIRDMLFAPIAEEIVFRATFIALLVSGGMSLWMSVFLAPLLFGLAHMHHVFTQVRAHGRTVQQAMLVVTFQLAFTTVFGVYAAFLFVRTGHISAPIVCHIFCNCMGFPDFAYLWHHRTHGILFRFLLALGLLAFIILLTPCTHPGMYGSPYYA